MSNEWRARRRPHNYVRYRAETGEDYGEIQTRSREGKLRRESGRAGRAGGSVEKRPLERAVGVAARVTRAASLFSPAWRSSTHPPLDAGSRFPPPPFFLASFRDCFFHPAETAFILSISRRLERRLPSPFTSPLEEFYYKDEAYNSWQNDFFKKRPSIKKADLTFFLKLP